MRKNKQITALIITSAVVLALGGTVAAIKVLNKQAEQKEADASVASADALEQELSLYDFDASLVTDLTLQNPEETIHLTKDSEGNWVIVGNEDYPVTQTTINAITNTLSKLKAGDIVEDTLANKGDYGLDAPAYVVKASLSDGSEICLNFGLYNSYKNLYYMYAEGKNNVYLMGSTMVSYASNTTDQLLSVSAVKLPDSGDVTGVKVTNGETQWQLTYEESDILKYSYYPYDTWFYDLEDERLAVADADTVNSLLTALCSWQVATCENYAPTQEELKQYGLLENQIETATVLIDYNEEVTPEEGDAYTTPQELTLYIGGLKAGDAEANVEDQYYVRASDSEIVYVVKASDIYNVINYQKHDFINKGYAMVLSTNIDSIDLKFSEDKTITYQLVRTKTTNDEGNEVTTTTYQMNGTELDGTYVIAIQYELTALGADRVMTEQDEIIPYDPELEITYHMYDCPAYDEVVIGFTPYNDNYDMVTINGESNLLINKNEIASLVSDLNEALDVLEMIRENQKNAS